MHIRRRSISVSALNMTIQNLSPAVRMVEVGPRDGLQAITDPVPTSVKLDLIRRLEETGLRSIELTSAVSPKAVPQLADCRDVLQSATVQKLLTDPRLRLPVLVSNTKGLEIALRHGVQEVAVFISASEGFSRANINCTVAQGIERAKKVIEMAVDANINVRGYVSCIFSDPYDGPTPPSNVLHCVKALLDAGCYEVSLGDTLGVGSPSNVRSLITYLITNGVPTESLAGHFHDTYGQAVANVWEAYSCGLRVFDSSVGGLGGCPFAPGAKGNVASEDVVYMFHNAGIQTGVDLAKLVDIGDWISRHLSRPNASRVGTALAARNKPVKSLSPQRKPSREPTVRWNKVSVTEDILIQRCDEDLKIILNRPKARNVLTTSTMKDLTAVVTGANDDPLISRIIVAGSGKFFCTGIELATTNGTTVKEDLTDRDEFRYLTALLKAIDNSPKVTIACINGPAYGAGAGLAFACDIRLYTHNAALTVNEGKEYIHRTTPSKSIARSSI